MAIGVLMDLFRRHSRFSAAGAVLLLATVIMYSGAVLEWMSSSYAHIFMIFWSFVGGMVLCYMFLGRTKNMMPNFLIMYNRKKEPELDDLEREALRKSCPVCGDPRCARHRPGLSILDLQPWTSLKVTEKVDMALSEFLELVLRDFVYTWYRDLSTDEAFVDEMRVSLRFILSCLIRRIKKTDLPTFIVNKLIKAAMSHLDKYVRAMESAPPGADLEKATLELYGSELHCVMQNRRTELQYLRYLSGEIFPYILPARSLKCKSLCALLRELLSASVLMPAIDKIADPDFVNNLMLVFLDETPMAVATEPPSHDVDLLAHFSQPRQAPIESALRLDLPDIMNNQTTLFRFMQFLKDEASVHVLQFCLSVEDFNRRSLNPDMTDQQKMDLHQEAKMIYEMYFKADAADKIQFPADVTAEIKSIVEGPPEGVTRLRTSTPLFSAYEHAYGLLENTFLPLFYQSDDYYTMLCGGRLPTNIPKSASSPNLESVLYDGKSETVSVGLNLPTGSASVENIPISAMTNMVNSCKSAGRKSMEPFAAVSKFGNKLKEMLRSNTVDDRLLALYDDQEDQTPDISPMEPYEEEELEDEIEAEFIPKDLSAWRVAIPRAESRYENGKQYYVYIISVQRIDIREGETSGPSGWETTRRYNEFYVLENKLTEFHGETLLEDCCLPTKRIQLTKPSQEFIDSKIAIFEKWLQVLLTKPALRGSELVHSFLSPGPEFETRLLTDVNIGKMLKSVPNKLVKEKGQHLEPFLQAFLASTETTKPRQSKPEEIEESPKDKMERKIAYPIYGNNAAGLVSIHKTEPDGLQIRALHGAADFLLYIARTVYKVPTWFHHVAMAARIVGKHALEGYLDSYLAGKIEQVKQEHQVVGLIHLLRDVLFFDNDPPRTDEDKRVRAEETLKEMKAFLPKLFVMVIGAEKQHIGTKTIFDVLQKPRLNKQLGYVMLDLAILEFFPEIQESSDIQQTGN
ncbi:sorting nexin-14-like isoform X2 [Branchiostoma floridae]|uniref:Sorting nexin-14-like isoform X2 n=1 Tax=Branchiostoma floridae TaxID=7739 RepID=A0A9J7M9M2_BRAFL|nr:sorting nexin-14-like isoform X2 [Branchiostoma floridae]